MKDASLLMTDVLVRLLLAFVCGAVIGIEREYKRRPAGFRTHILICLGAAITTLTGEYLILQKGFYGDVLRLGAQVVAGIGFVGAGTIIVTKHNRVRGLTTAAGLWVTAIIGLACGVGYLAGAIAATGIILFAEIFLSKFEFKIRSRNEEVTLYVEYKNKKTVNVVIDYFHRKKVKILDLEISKIKEKEACAIFIVSIDAKKEIRDYVKEITELSPDICVQIL